MTTARFGRTARSFRAVLLYGRSQFWSFAHKPDGTVLNVSLSFTKVGTITLSRGEGLLTKDLGHFAVSRDPVVLTNSAGRTILSGGSFQ